MKKKIFAALLTAGALLVVPVGGNFAGLVASASSNNSMAEREQAYLTQINNRVAKAESGATVRMNDVTTLSSDFIKELAARDDVTVVLEYTYMGVDYVVTIPAGGVIDTGVKWYGPLYLAQLYGNDLNRSSAGEVYAVKSGDTLSRIAAANNMTLDELRALNPQITNVNQIRVGQEIHIK